MATQEAIAKHLDLSERKVRDVLKDLGINHKEATLEQIRIAYIRRLRETAAGRAQTKERATRDQAETRRALADAQVKELAYLKESGRLLEADAVRQLIETWATTARTEYGRSIDKIISEVENQFGIQVDRKYIESVVDATCRVIANYPAKLAGGSDTGS